MVYIKCKLAKMRRRRVKGCKPNDVKYGVGAIRMRFLKRKKSVEREKKTDIRSKNRQRYSRMEKISELQEKLYRGELLTKEEVMPLREAPLKELCQAADEIRAHFCGRRFDLCTIINGKCGRCSEDCKYCAQSVHYTTACGESYPLLSTEKIVAQAKRNAAQGVLRYSIVTSGRRLSEAEVEQVCESIRAVRREAGIEVCVSFGLLGEADFKKLKEAGASRVHCNLESSARYFTSVSHLRGQDRDAAGGETGGAFHLQRRHYGAGRDDGRPD